MRIKRTYAFFLYHTNSMFIYICSYEEVRSVLTQNTISVFVIKAEVILEIIWKNSPNWKNDESETQKGFVTPSCVM